MPLGSHGSGSPTAPPEEFVAAWQLLLTVVARSLDVAVGLVIRQSDEDQSAPMAPQFRPNNRFLPKELHDLAPGQLYQRVISDETELVVIDADTAREWSANPELKSGLVSYLGYPVYGTDREVFATICVLDDEPRDFSRADRALLLSARDAIHDSLGVTDAPSSARTSADRADRVRPALESFGLWDYQPATGELRMSPSVARTYCTHGESAPTSLDEWISRISARHAPVVRRALEHVIAGTWESATCAAILPTAAGADIVRIVARGVAAPDGSLTAVVGVQTVVHADDTWLTVAPMTSDHPASIDVDTHLNVVAMTDAMAELLGVTEPQPGRPVQELLLDTVESAMTLARFRMVVQGPRSPRFMLIHARPDGPPYAAILAPLSANDGAREDLWRVTLIGDDWRPSVSEEPESGRDDVTGLPTRSTLERSIRTEVARAPASRLGVLLTLTVLEVSNLHLILSRVGHQAAEACLATLAETIQGEGRLVTSLGLGFLSILTRGVDPDLSSTLRRELLAVDWDSAATPALAFSNVFVESGDQRSVGELLTAATPVQTDGGEPTRPVIAAPRTARSGSGLTARERQVVAMVAEGLTNRAIADSLHLAVRTVEGHLERARVKLGLHSRTQLVAWFYTQPEASEGHPQPQ